MRLVTLPVLLVTVVLLATGCMQRVIVHVPQPAEQIDLVAHGYTAVAVDSHGSRHHRGWEAGIVDALHRYGVPVIDARAVSRRVREGERVALVRYAMDGQWSTRSQATPILSGRIWAIDAVDGGLLANHVVALRLHEADLARMRNTLRDHPRHRVFRDDPNALAQAYAIEQAVGQMATRYLRKDLFFRRSDDPRYLEAMAYVHAGEWDQAVPLFEAMAAGDPEDRHLRRNLHIAREAQGLLRSGSRHADQ